MVDVESSRHRSALHKNFGGQQGNCSRIPKSYYDYLGLRDGGAKHDDHSGRANARLTALRSQGKVSPVVCQSKISLYPHSLRGSLAW